jgi:hypothetical protein
MARGDWTAGQQRCAVMIPIPLLMLVDSLQNTHCFDSRNATLRYLIETHPAIAELRERVYARAQQDLGEPRSD